MIEIQLNGEAQQIKQGSTVSDMLETMGFSGKRVAIEYNQEILPKSQHGQTVLLSNDRVEIVHAIGGG